MNDEALRGHDPAYMAEIELAKIPAVSEAVPEQLKIEMAWGAICSFHHQSTHDSLDLSHCWLQDSIGLTSLAGLHAQDEVKGGNILKA